MILGAGDHQIFLDFSWPKGFSLDPSTLKQRRDLTTEDIAKTDTVQPKEIGKKFCSNCGAQIDEKAVICVKCGVAQSALGIAAAGISEKKNKTTAALLALFLGGIGIHKLYLKRGNWWLYLIFCWTLIPALIAFIEAVQLFMMSEADFDRQYNAAQ